MEQNLLPLKTVRRDLDADERIALTLWMNRKTSDEVWAMTSIELADIATKEMGFTVSESTVGYQRRVMFPREKKDTTLADTLVKIDARLAAIEKALNIKP